MKLSGRMLSGLAGGLALCMAPGAWAITSANPYEAIIERNVFSLKPPPPPVDPNEAKKQPPAKVTLTGITTILGYPQALLKTAAAPAPRTPVRPGAPPPPAAKGDQFYILRQGEREGDIEVLDIDAKAETVKIKQDGTEFVLDFEKNGQKPAGAVAGGPPGVIPPPTGFGNGMPRFPMPARPMRTAISGAPNAGSAAPSTGGFGQASQTGGFGMPAATASLSPQQAAQQQAAQLSPEANALLIEAERERLQQAGNPLANLMPITRATPTGAPGTLTPPGAATPQVPGVPQPYYPTFPGRAVPPAPQ